MQQVNLYGFHKHINDSDRGQDFVTRWLITERGATVEDKRKDMTYQKRGIDLVVNGVDSEFKSDTQMAKTKNLAYELISNSRKATPGCLLISESTLLLYFDSTDCVLHTINLPKLRLAVETVAHEPWKMYTVNTGSYGSMLYASFGALIPVKWIEEKSGAYVSRHELACVT